MFVKLTKHKVGSGSKTQVRLIETYRPTKGANPKQRVVEDLGWLEDQEDEKAFLEQLHERCENAKQNKEKIDFRFDTKKAMHDEDSRVVNYGTCILELLYNLFDFPLFFKKYRVSKAEYDLEEIFRYLVTMRCIYPDSKRATYSYANHIFEFEKHFELEDVYKALDEIAKLRYELQDWVNKRIRKLFPSDSGFIYFDVTNFYFEIDYPKKGKLRQRGVSKEHRVDPIVQSALMLNSKGIPMLTEAFSGNSSEKIMLQPMMEKAGQLGMIKDHCVVVADKGINSGPNIDYLVNHGHGYVFSQTLRGKAGKRYQEALFEETGYIWNKEKTYKYKLYTEPYNGKDLSGKKVVRQRLVLLYWSKAMADRERMRREEKVERARKKLTNNAYMIQHGNDQYIRTDLVMPETGEVVEPNQVLSIDEEKIQSQEEFDGYNAIITSEMSYDHDKIRSTYHRLWMIENSFRIEKTDLVTRAIYLQLDSRIYGHLVTCHLALVLIRLIQLLLQDSILSAERICRALRRCELLTPQKGIVYLLDPSRKIEFKSYINDKGIRNYTLGETGDDEVLCDYEKICRALGVELSRNTRAIMRVEDFRAILRKAKLDFSGCDFKAWERKYTLEELNFEEPNRNLEVDIEL